MADPLLRQSTVDLATNVDSETPRPNDVTQICH